MSKLDTSTTTTPTNKISLSHSQCSHTIIEDLIDISPDDSKYVYYCEKCFECFIDICGNKTRPVNLRKPVR
jgi:hypothetical protein